MVTIYSRHFSNRNDAFATEWGKLFRTTFVLAGQAVVVSTRTGTTGPITYYYLFNDHLGSASTMTTTGGSVVHQARFLPFGGPRTWTGAATTPWLDRGYTGHLHNDEVGLIYMNARYYVPSLGRFASADTLIPNPANPQAFNRYSYTLNNPVLYNDPTGHCVDGVSTWVCIAGAVAVITKVIDYGLTAWDTYQAGKTLSDPNASSTDKIMAGLTVSLAVLFEALEPDDLSPVGLPLDDLGRRAITNGAQEALEEGGSEGLEDFLRNQLGDHADVVINKLRVTDFLSQIKPNSQSGARAIVGEIQGNAMELFQGIVDPATIKQLGNNPNHLYGFTVDGHRIDLRLETSTTPAIDFDSLFEAGLTPYKKVHVTSP